MVDSSRGPSCCTTLKMDGLAVSAGAVPDVSLRPPPKKLRISSSRQQKFHFLHTGGELTANERV
jgi:hypothetical protein